MASLKFWPRKGLAILDAPTPPKPDSRLPVRSASYLKPNSDSLDREELRARLGKMTDAELRRFAQAAQNLCSSNAHDSESAWNLFSIQLEECQAEWRRRHFA